MSIIKSRSKNTQSIGFSTEPSRRFFSLKKKASIGIISPSYGMEKVSYGLAPEPYKFYKVTRLPIQHLERRGTFLQQTPIVFDYPVQLVHTFNEIPVGARPFIVSFENELPRYLENPKKWQISFGLDILESNRCKAIFALSEAAKASFIRRLPKDRNSISLTKKIVVFRGSVRPERISTESDRYRTAPSSNTAPLKVLFVGRDAFGKGLMPALDAVECCRREGLNVEMTVVCGFEVRSYISKGLAPEPDATRRRMQTMTYIVHHEALSNAQVHGLMRSHDVLLFPTLDESLGWVAVEAGLAGLPVITTDIFALPELVRHGDGGFLLPLRQNAGRWIGLSLEGSEFAAEVSMAFSELSVGIYRHLAELCLDRSLLHDMALRCKSHMQSLYDYERAGAILASHYNKAIN